MNFRFVAISPYDPYSTSDHAGGAYFQRVLREWQSSGWRVTTIAPAQSRNATHSRSGGPMGATILLDASPADDTLVRRLLRNLSTGQSELLGSAWWENLPSRAREALYQADIIDLEWPTCYRLAPVIREVFPNKPIIATVHDIGYQKSWRNTLESRGLRARAQSFIRYIHARRNDRLAFRSSDVIFAFNPNDEIMVKRLGVQTPVRLAPALVERRDELNVSVGAKRILFVGAMHRPENVEAVRWFLDECWPLVRREHPSTIFRIAGSSPPEWLLRRRGFGVEVTGYLDDIMDAYDDVSLVIAPIRLGAGLKFKVAQALVLGFPVVGTSVAIEGINELLGRNILTASDSATDFANAVNSQLANGSSWPREQIEAFRSAFDFDTQVRSMVSSVSHLFQDKTRDSC